MTSGTAATISMSEAARVGWDVIVIGAGPAGSVAAIVLSRLGRRVLLVDRANFPRDKVCGCCLGPAAVESLRELGLAEVLDAHHATPMMHFDLRAAQHQLNVPLHGGRVLSRRLFDAALVEKAIGCGVTFLPRCLAGIGSVDDLYRHVQLRSAGQHGVARTRLVIAAGGLGFAIDGSHSAGQRRERLWRRSRVGGGTTIASTGVDLPWGEVRSIVARRGYVGLARLEDDQLAVGGAFDAALIRERGGLGGAAAQVFEESNVHAPAALADAHWLGAPQLTRQPFRVAAERVLAVGDAAGFVEPFTGEGMTWAIQSARQAAGLAEAVLSRADVEWDPAVEERWTRLHRSLVRSSQIRCRGIAETLRHPMLVHSCMMTGRIVPRLYQMVVDRVHGRGLGAREPLSTRLEVARGGA